MDPDQELPPDEPTRTDAAAVLAAFSSVAGLILGFLLGFAALLGTLWLNIFLLQALRNLFH